MLTAPYREAHGHLFEPLSEMETLSLLKRCLLAPAAWVHGAKGCGLDPQAMESDSPAHASVKAFLCLHDDARRRSLASRWMPLALPGSLPVDAIQEYFGAEVGWGGNRWSREREKGASCAGEPCTISRV